MNDLSNKVDITIIGAGVVGLAIASELASSGKEILLLEKNATFGAEQSSRNSEVIHAGIYYDRGSLKARFSVEGNRLLYSLCEKSGIAFRKCGKIMISTNAAEDEKLAQLYELGRANGAPVEMLSSRKMKLMEPELEGISAFLSPSTGIIDAYGLMKYFLNHALHNGVQIAYKSRVEQIEAIRDGFRVTVGNDEDRYSFQTKILINSAGLHSDAIAKKAGVDVEKCGYKIHWCKGEYYGISGGKGKSINRLVYPVPMDISVGVHLCFDVDWRLKIGPLFYYVDRLDYSVDSSRQRSIWESSMLKAMPFIRPDDLAPEGSGIMAMLQGEGEPFRDFVIKRESDRGLPNLIDLIGIDSPGLTSSPAIARYVSTLVRELL
jgi:L-2-hydroxyglutarate oxidase LhgO